MVQLFTAATQALARTRDRGLARYLWLQACAQDFLARKQEGASLTEYALLLALIAVVCIAALTFLGGSLSSIFSKLGSKLGAIPVPVD